MFVYKNDILLTPCSAIGLRVIYNNSNLAEIYEINKLFQCTNKTIAMQSIKIITIENREKEYDNSQIIGDTL